MIDLKKLIQVEREALISTRRDLHRIPETGFNEEKTSAYVADWLRKAGYQPKTGIAKWGVMAELATGRPGPTVMLRADIDALPVTEATGLPFASTHPGTMHACGHDAHTAMLLVTAKILKSLAPKLRGHVKFIFQPAEEGPMPGGAKPMIEAGVMDNPKVDYAFGCHVWPDIPEGSIGVKTGPLQAATGTFDIKIIGQGGHGAWPHRCVDALEIATQCVSALQRIVSRQISPLNPAVVTVGKFNSGRTHNIIAQEAEFGGTARTFDQEDWDRFPERMEKIVAGVAASMGAKHEFKYTRGYPVLVNDKEMAEVARQCAIEAVGADKVVETTPVMGGEDVAFFFQKARGCYYNIGVWRPGQSGIHSNQFDFNEEVMLLGVEMHCRVTLRMLS